MSLITIDDKGNVFVNDPFITWLGIAVTTYNDGRCELRMTLRDEMLNGLGLAHGGILFSLADSCFGLACNSKQGKAVSLQASINFFKTAAPGDVLIAEAFELHNGQTTGVYEVKISNAQQQLLAVYRGTCLKLNPR